MIENVIQIKSGITISASVSENIQEKIVCAKRLYLESCYMYSWNGKYLSSIIDNSVITDDQIIEEIKTVPKNFNERNANCKAKKCLYFTWPFIN